MIRMTSGLLMFVLACGQSSGEVDAGTDAAADAGTDAATDAGSDAAPDAGSDAATDAATDAGSDAASDTGSDAASDSGTIINCRLDGILCDIVPPACATGLVHSVVDSCFGPCVPIDSCFCDEPADCPEPGTYTCHMFRNRCGPFL